MTATAALVVAAGRGERFGGALPKQYAPLAGTPILRRTAEALLGHGRIDAVAVVIAPGQEALYAATVGDLPLLLPPVTGDADRQGSVLLGLEALARHGPDRVLVHDAVRPMAGAALIDRVLAGLDRAPAVLPVLPVVDTLKRVAGDAVLETVPRDGLARAQTPQGFHFAPLLDAHRRLAGRGLTDDAAVAAAAGLHVLPVAGDERNIKITLQTDLALVEQHLRGGARTTRVGLGFDVHRVVRGRPLLLCGVPVAHEFGLAGHSDADVALHALTDALLGTIGAGDIGSHFPPSDPQWRDADSALFLRHAAALVAARGGRIENVDLTLICERPKIGPHREAMTARLCQLLGLAGEAVSIKATTSEGLGFTGRGEGIAAQAVAAVSFAA